MSSPEPQQARQSRMLVNALVVSAGVTVVVAVVLGALVSPWLYAIALVAIIDLGLAWAFSSGRLKPASGERLGPAAEADPSHNPYARED